MRLVIISDTHCATPDIPDGDVLIHCGDHTMQGSRPESKHSLEWFNSLPHKHKLFIAGNHELGWEMPFRRSMYINAYAPNCIYLHNSGIEINGVKFWGSPIQPEFMGWAFQLPRELLEQHWKQIPDDTDVLITHGPPYGFGDRVPSGEKVGDTALLSRVLKVKPKVHCFGHIHGGYGEWSFNGIHFINASINNEAYHSVNKPVVIELYNDGFNQYS